jgi:hypothetical protein
MPIIQANGIRWPNSASLGVKMDQEIENEVDESQEIEVDEANPEEKSGETPEGQDENESNEDDDSVVVSIDGEEENKAEAETTEAPQWVKDLRKEHRATVRELREIKAKEAAREAQVVQQKAQELGEKPTLASCDYDEEVYEPKLAEWYKRKSEIEAKERDAKAQQERQNQEWQEKLEAHKKAASALRVPDYEEASEVVKEAFSDIQYAIMHEADNSAVLEYAIGKRPAKVKELASITNPIKFAMALAKLETQVKTTSRKVPPAPEGKVRGSAPASGAVDSQLDRLRAEAEKTGDMSKVIAYKNQMRAAKK